jgi:hypothetical protein
MRLVNHSSELIHQVYQRDKVDDVAPWRDAVQFPVTNARTPKVPSRKRNGPQPTNRPEDDDQA